MKFYDHNVDCNISDTITATDWDIFDQTQSRDLSLLLRKYYLKHCQENEYMQYSFDAFQNLKYLNSKNEVHFTLNDIPDLKLDQRSCVAFANRNKPKTIVALNGGSWIRDLYMDGGSEHQYHWLFRDMFEKQFNIISIAEDPRRSYTNPILYDSCFYNGINSDIDSLSDMCDYIQALIPSEEYYVIADCKNGHSASVLAYFLDATKVFIHSGITTSNTKVVKDIYYNDSDECFIKSYFQIPVEVMLRHEAFAHDLPNELTSINNIAKTMPYTKFMYMYHNQDKSITPHVDNIVESNNVTKKGIDTTAYTLSDHYIMSEIRKSGYVHSFFNM